MKTYTQEELNKIIENPRLWLDSEGGERANLSGSNLSGSDLRGADLYCADLSGSDLSGSDLSDADLSLANLSRADLRGADLSGSDLSDADLSGVFLWGCAGNNKEIKSIFIFEEYQVTYTKGVLQIGYKQHPISDWWKLDDSAILEMDGKKALKFWRENKDYIRITIEKYPAV